MSTPWNIGLAEGIGIIVFIAGIVLLVMVFVLCRKMISRKKKRLAEPEDKRLGPTTAFLQRPYFDSKLNKNIYSDIPPQVPVRPISYTPSIPSDSRNNLDRNSFEGSAIPEHPEFSTFNPESMHGHRKAVAVCSVAPNLPPPPPSNSPSDSDSIQKPSWDFDYDGKGVMFSISPVLQKWSWLRWFAGMRMNDAFQSEMVLKTHLHIPVTGWGLGALNYFYSIRSSYVLINILDVTDTHYQL